MATLAIAVANDRGLDIITSDASVHRSVCTQNHSDVFDELLGVLRHDAPSRSGEIVDELAAVYMTTCFDVSKLSVDQIVELQGDGKDLRRFKDIILPIANRIPDIPNVKERERRLKEGASEIRAEWIKWKKSLPRFAVEAIFESTEARLPALASTALGGATYSTFGSAAGIAVAFASYAGWRMWRKFKKDIDSPYHYLNRIHRAGAMLVIPTSVKQK